MVLSVLPGGKATLIVRVLEAFIALQYQAGVLTEEVVLAVQLLVEVRVATCHMDMAHGHGAWPCRGLSRVSRIPPACFFLRLPSALLVPFIVCTARKAPRVVWVSSLCAAFKVYIGDG